MTGIPVKQLKDKDGNDIQPNSPDKVGYPNTTEQSLSWGVNQTINDDGWVYVYLVIANGDSFTLTINGKIRLLYQNDSTDYVNIYGNTFPVKKNDVINASGGTRYQKVSFFSNRTNLENGGGSLTP